MSTLVLKALLANPDTTQRFHMLADSVPGSTNSRNVALLGAVVLLFTALTLIRRAIQPLREVILTVLAAVVGAMLVFAALVLLLTAMFVRG
jgi:hypothetical protein